MKIEYINPFVQAASSVLTTILRVTPNVGRPALLPSPFRGRAINIVCGVTGQAQGQVVYSMDHATALGIAAGMIGMPVAAFDQLAASAIAELGNMISGNALVHLSDNGYICDITPPTLVSGADVEISTLSIPAVALPLTLPQGLLLINIGLQGRK